MICKPKGEGSYCLVPKHSLGTRLSLGTRSTRNRHGTNGFGTFCSRIVSVKLPNAGLRLVA
jgi:hypothetical protein